MPPSILWVRRQLGTCVDYDEDYDLAVLTSAKAMAMTIIDLLANNAERAVAVKHHQAPLDKTRTPSLMRSMYEEALPECDANH